MRLTGSEVDRYGSAVEARMHRVSQYSRRQHTCFILFIQPNIQKKKNKHLIELKMYFMITFLTGYYVTRR